MLLEELNIPKTIWKQQLMQKYFWGEGMSSKVYYVGFENSQLLIHVWQFLTIPLKI